MAKAIGEAQLSRRELAAWRGLLRTHARVLAALDAELEQAHGLAVPEYEVLLVLTQCGDQHLRMSELADAALLTRSGMTRLVDRLEKQGLVRRERCPADGRGTYAVITPEGAAAFAAARPTHIAGVRRLFLDPLKKKEQRLLAEAFGVVLGEPSGEPSAS
jgi:DNA-binding MarR family transcriptional regulator